MEMEKREKIFLFFPFSFDKSNNPKIKRARVDAHQTPQKVLVHLDSRTVAMEVGIR